MSVPCRLISCDADLVEIETPLLGRCTLASRCIRAIELDRRPVRLVPEREAFRWLEEWLERIPPENIMGNGTPTPVVVPDDEVAERIKEALIIPRIRQDPPPTHLLVARNGDVRRGNLVSIDENSVRLRVRQREQVLARDLLRQVVGITEPERSERTNRIRILLHDGTRLEFERIGVEGENLVLESPDLGRLVVPPQAVRELTLGDFETVRHPDEYASWVIRPAGTGPSRETRP